MTGNFEINLPKKYKTLVTAGCSFTAGSSYDVTDPVVWPHFLRQKIGVENLINLAMPASGVVSMNGSLIFCLETKSFINAENTLVIFNISGLNRIDTICPNYHPDRNKYFPWETEFNFGWINAHSARAPSSPYRDILHKNYGIDELRISNSFQIINTISYLEANNFDYFFMLMDDTIIKDSPNFLLNYLNLKSRNWIKFDEYSNMYEFCRDKGNLRKDEFHPSVQGHKEISDYILSHIKDSTN